MMLVRSLVSLFLLASLLFAREAAAAAPLRRVAVIVGANDAAPGRQALRYSHADAQLMADVLTRVGRFAKADVHTLLEPHPPEVLATLDKIGRELSATGGDSLLFFYYSGHSDGQQVFPHGEQLPLTELRDRLARSGARVRVAVLDTCRGGSWTRAKGLTVGPPLEPIDLMNVSAEGMALLSSSSGLENAHEAGALKGSFFTHHVAAGLLGAADASGDGNVTLQEVFTYARERTVRDSARMAVTPQHPSFDMQLRGRQDIVLAQTSSSTSALDLTQTNALEIIHLDSGVTVVETLPGARKFRLGLVPGHYILRRVSEGRVLSKSVDIAPGAVLAFNDGQLESTSEVTVAMKDGEQPAPAAAAPAPAAPCPPCPDCEDKERCDRRKRSPVERTTVFGVRGSLTNTHAAETDGTFGAATLSVSSEQYKTRGLLAMRASTQASLGGGTAGLEGSLGGTLTAGIRVPVADNHGPIVRIGLGGELLGNSRFYFSRISLPIGEVGYQYLEGRTVLEFGVRGAPVLTGRYNTGHVTRRETDGLEGGAYLAAHSSFGRLDASYMRMIPGDRNAYLGKDVDVLRGSACGYVRDRIAICLDGMFVDGGASYSRPAFTLPTNPQAIYGGLTVGVLAW
jgi:hypothetical protein